MMKSTGILQRPSTVQYVVVEAEWPSASSECVLFLLVIIVLLLLAIVFYNRLMDLSQFFTVVMWRYPFTLEVPIRRS